MSAAKFMRSCQGQHTMHVSVMTFYTSLDHITSSKLQHSLFVFSPQCDWEDRHEAEVHIVHTVGHESLLSADDHGLLRPPLVIADGAPAAIEADLHSALGGPAAVDQSDVSVITGRPIRCVYEEKVIVRLN